MEPWEVALAGFVFMLGAIPAHLRMRGRAGTWAIRPWWLVSLGTLILLAAFALALWPPGGGTIDSAACFGPQRTGAVERGKLEAYGIRVQVVPGRDLHLLRTANPTLTLVDGKPQPAGPDPVDPARSYVHATLALRTELGWHVYDCAVRIRGGPLDGAVVTIASASAAPAPRITEPYQAYYPLPERTSVPAGDLDYEVVFFTAK